MAVESKLKEEKPLKEIFGSKVSNNIDETEFDLNEIVVLEDPICWRAQRLWWADALIILNYLNIKLLITNHNLYHYIHF